MGASLELLGREQSVGEIDKQPGGDDAGEPVVEDHGCLLQTVAGVDVGDRQHEEAEAQSNQGEVQHADVSLRMVANNHLCALLASIDFAQTPASLRKSRGAWRLGGRPSARRES